VIRNWIRRWFAPGPTGAPSLFITTGLNLVAAAWRRLLFRTTFIAITGSFGKTTTKECLAQMLASQGPTARSWRNQNNGAGVAASLLRVRPWHRFAVIELGTGGPGHIGPASRLVRPHVAIVLSVGRAHMSAFATLEEIAEEKAGIVEGLLPSGTVLLNGDDHRVKAMAAKTDRQVHMFGTDPESAFRADGVSAQWPARLQFRFHHGTESTLVRTPYVGEHWLSSVLAALAAARICGLDLSEAGHLLAQGKPFDARLEPVELPNGAIFLRDEYNASVDTFKPAFEVMRRAKAHRRVVVASDYAELQERQRRRSSQLGRETAEVAEAAVFVGASSRRSQRAAIEAGMASELVHSFTDLQEAAAFLKTFLQPGDLVLLKGRASHHLSRLFFAQLGQVDCWKSTCSKMMLCDICPELGPAAREKHRTKLVAPVWVDDVAESLE
jgi:UDP-N-acetylmuramoyl-tripeptide--D-alanyl-D-alanine ligase